MSYTKSFSLPVVSFRKLDTPFQEQGYRDYFAVVETKYLPQLTGWRKINVRDPKLTGAVPKAIRESFHDNPEMFLFMNRGIVLSVDSLQFNNKTATLTFELTNPNLHGLLDGGHTYDIVIQETENSAHPQFVKLEILEGFAAENITQVVDARNTSNQVRDESLMNLAGEFDELKKALAGAPYLDLVAFKEYEVDGDNNPKPIDVREIVAILTAFDKDHFDDKVHPINAYRSKAACLKHFGEHLKSYRKIYPLAQELLDLYDGIQEKLPGLYNAVRGQSGDVTGGKFGRLTGVTAYKREKQYAKLYFIKKRSPYSVPAGFVYPILAAFRALLEERNGRYVWGKGMVPVELLDGDLGLKLADTVGSFAREAQNPSKTGKSPLVWQSCYQCVEVMYLRAK